MKAEFCLRPAPPRKPPWEQPGTGHGLLTYATIEALTKAVGETVSFPEVAGEIIRRTRVEAERIGVTQTPVFLGSVQGGLVFPVLKRGDNFVATFPAVAVRQISGSFAELVEHAFPQEVVDQWVAHFPRPENPLQLKAVNDYGVLEGKSLLVVAPTSSGKTLIRRSGRDPSGHGEESRVPPAVPSAREREIRGLQRAVRAGRAAGCSMQRRCIGRRRPRPERPVRSRLLHLRDVPQPGARVATPF